MFLRTKIYFQLILLLFSAAGLSQKPNLEFIRESEGLSKNLQWSSDAILMDQNHFLWIATLHGLNKYDGYKIQTFDGRNGLPYDIPQPSITAIEEDDNGILWFGTEDEGVFFFDPRKEIFTKFHSENYLSDSLEFKQINNISKDRNGNLLINTAFQGLYKYIITKDSLYEISRKHPAYKEPSLNNILVLKDGRIVMVVYNGVYIEKSEGSETWDYYEVDRKKFLFNALEREDGILEFNFINYPLKLLINPQTKQSVEIQNNNGEILFTPYQDSDGNIWRSHASGMLTKEYSESNASDTFHLNTIIGGKTFPIAILDIFSHEDGYMYYNTFAAGAGMFNYKKEGIEPFPYKATCPILIHNDKIYYANEDQIFLIEGDTITPLPIDAKNRGDVINLYVDNQEKLWICRRNEAKTNLEMFDQKRKNLSLFIEPSQNNILQLKDGRIAIEHALLDTLAEDYIFIGDSYTQLSGQKYPDFKANDFIQRKNGEIWIATFSDGVFVIENNFKKAFPLPSDLNANGNLYGKNITYLFEDKDQNVYVVSDQGISIWNESKKKFSYILNREIDLKLEVQGMIQYEEKVWILMPNHICSYEFENNDFHIYNLHPDYRVELSEAQELQIDSNGMIYYLSINGIVQFNPDLLSSLKGPDKIFFTELFIRRNRIYPNDNTGILDSALMFQNKIVVPYHQRDLGFSFVSPFGNRINTTYYYQLEGYNNQWTKIQEERTLHFTGLREGNYKLVVKAKSGNGIWTNEESFIKFRILAPWYRKWWAYVLYIFLVISSGYALYRFRVKQILKYQSLRTKISSDLHDDVGTILGSIAMESEMLSYDKNSKISDELKRLSLLSRDAMGRMRDTVWAIDSRKDEFRFLALRMKDYLHDTLSRSEFEYIFNSNLDESTKPIAPHERQNVYLIFKEAINNALKYSKGDQIYVNFHFDGRKYILSIKDNGSTIVDITKGSGLGLGNMKMRAKNIKGSIQFMNDNGFEVRVVF